MNSLHGLWHNPRSTSLRVWMFNIHLYCGLALGFMVTIVGLTGSLIVYKPETERLMSAAMANVQPLREKVSVDDLYRSVHAFRPTHRIDRLYTWGGPTAAWMFRTIRPDGRRQYIYVDQYRGNVLGEYIMDGSLLQWIYELHDNLLLGKRGLAANGWAALLLTVLCFTGSVIWWPGARRVITGFHFHTRAGWKTQNYDIHKILGFLAVIPLAVLAISGAYYAFPDAYRKIAAGVSGTVSFLETPTSHSTSGTDARLDKVFTVATSTIPDAELTILTFPSARNGSFTARKRLAGDWSRLGNQYLYIDRYSGDVLRVDRLDRLPLGARLVNAMSPLHYGSFAGHWSRILWIFMGLVPGVPSISGFLMWWNRVIVKRLRPAEAALWATEGGKDMRRRPVIEVLLFLIGVGSACLAQTSDTATIIGAVTDSSGAAVSGAVIELTDQSSRQTRRQTANAEGQYTITSVLPGTYRVSATAPGFRQSIVAAMTVDLAKSYVLNFSLEIGAITDTVEVKASAAVELQTLDSTVGAVIKGDSLLRMPSINRSSLTFFALQPITAPSRGVVVLSAGQDLGGSVSGARADENTFTIDGIDVSDYTAGTNFYSGAATDYNGPSPMVPAPAESIDEFRLSTNNLNATYHQSPGGQLNLVTKRGSNDFHGSAYYYLQNNDLNANRWDYNRTGIARPPLHDNRFGASTGGPVIRNKTFFYANYEGRRLPQTSAVTRLVPTDSLKQGILKFVDSSGVVRSYNVKDYDPRNLGIDPLVQAMWSRFPVGNDPGLGDGLNTTGFLAPVNSSLNMNFGVVRVDHIFSEKWRMNASYRYASQFANGTSQVDIAGFAPGDTPGKAAPAVHTNVQPRTLSVQLSANPTPHLLNDVTLGDARSFWADQRVTPPPQVPGTAGALAIAAGFLDQGLDETSGAARTRVWDNHNYQFRDNLSWVKGKHNLQFGGGLQYIPAFHQRDDKIVGTQYTALVYNLNALTSVSIPATNRPATCSASATTNCLLSTAVSSWNNLLAGSLGIVDSAGTIVTRNSSLAPLPPDTPIRSYVHWEDIDLYFNDVWRISKSFTITLGANYSIQTPPVGGDSSQAVPVDQTNGQELSPQMVFSNRAAAAQQGQVWNPAIAWLPVGKGGPQSIYKTAWDDLGPHVAASWNPSFKDGLLGRLFGDQKTVFRGGYGLVFDRINGSTNVFFPMLNVGFAQTLTCAGPRTNGTCAAGSDPTNAFRIGVDGSTVPLSTQLAASSLVPPQGNSETNSYALDPNLRPGYSHTANFTIQREIRSFVIEAGYVGHFGRNLMQSVDLNDVPYFFKDAASGQTLAQAYDAVAQYLRSGGAAANVPVQAWFENQLHGAAVCTSSCTAGLAATQNSSFTQGQLNALFNVINTQRPAGPITNFQVSSLWMRTNGGISNYNAGFLSFHRRFANGLTWQANYTLSKSLDEHGYNQEAESLVSNGYNLKLDYSPSAFDHTHVFNSNFFYDLPFGPGKHWGGTMGRGLGRLAGGWYLGGIFSAQSGAPVFVVESGNAWGGAPQVESVNAGAIAFQPVTQSSGVHGAVAGSGGVGTTGNPKAGGSGLNLFSNPAGVLSDFRPILLSADGRNGLNTLRGLSHWNLDVSIGKKTLVTERISVVFTADLINALNHVEYVDPTLSLQTPANFGVLTTQFGTPRAIQLGLRLEF